ncbi:hypothetical protein GLOTRDRAFT_114438 [Gloeophyllum trabeum ATCC 11539]|uniref:WD40 repeat-like protein n=1 Tax=Gloeophyllum trabeum (strain ATCC 11539 / FP-39264 / Madison 617) TaxID=670483 RepID=S7RWS0_GLOTA|nr:uncharacterized protein GLOTRDRAFT_114438 [Gloeophyllum trabeum ATCC 11539]EPQ57804.1 hypothetical protein GLOTRDRAFT_114438 [Gloeophyllum trabeum ATCC 11539]
MGRELRPRKSRPSYAALLRLEGDEAGPSMSARELEEAEGDSESDFAPDIAVQSAAEDEDEDDADADELDEEDAPAKAESPTPVSRPATKRKPQEQTRNAKGKGKEVGTKFAIEPRPRATVQLAPGLSRPLNRQMYALPMPSSNHRHRAAPIFRRQGNVERLLSPPKLFSAPSVTSSPNFTAHPAVMNRLGKAWGFNVGPGPLWDLMEDRAWYKEAVCGTENEEWEGNRRPRVFFDLAMPVGMRLLTREEASAYLPSDVVTTEEGDLRPPPPVRCFFGPYGKQTKHEMNIFDTLRISEHIPGSKAHVFNAGAPVWGLDWCPIHADDRPHRSYKQYLAAAPFPSRSHSPDIGAKVSRPSYACIQIWSLSPPEDVEMVDATAAPPGDDDFDPGHMRCEMVLCVESGPAHELKWCPLPSHDSRKLGLLAGTFEDGSLSIYAVPDPDSTPANSDANQPKFVHISEPFLLIELEETSCMTLDWANSEIIAVGCTNGSIAVYNVGEAIRQGVRSNLLPIYYMSIHQSAIRGLSWVRVPPASTSGAPLTGEDPTVIASGGYDGLECLTDIRDPHGNVFNRTRGS